MSLTPRRLRLQHRPTQGFHVGDREPPVRPLTPGAEYLYLDLADSNKRRECSSRHRRTHDVCVPATSCSMSSGPDSNYHLGEASTAAPGVRRLRQGAGNRKPLRMTGPAGHVGVNTDIAGVAGRRDLDVLSNSAGFGGVFAAEGIIQRGSTASSPAGRSDTIKGPRHAVLGTQADIAWSGISGGLSCTADCNPSLGFGNSDVITQQRLAWFGTARVASVGGRTGVLFYATGGLAYGRTSRRSSPASLTSSRFPHHLGDAAIQ